VILVAGGTGRLGRLVVAGLGSRGEAVRVLTRDPGRAVGLGPNVEVAVGDVRDPDGLGSAMSGVEAVVSAVHGFAGPGGVTPASVDRDGNGHLVDAAAAEGTDLVLLSIAGAAADAPMDLARMKHAAERRAIASGVPTTVVRPTAFMELWIEILRRTGARSGRPLVFGRGVNPINFVSVVDVAALVTRVTLDGGTRGEIFEIGGPEDLGLGELAEAVVAADGGSGTPRHLPRPFLRIFASTVGVVRPSLGRQMRGSIAMDTEPMVFRGGDDVRRRFREVPTHSVADVLAGVE